MRYPRIVRILNARVADFQLPDLGGPRLLAVIDEFGEAFLRNFGLIKVAEGDFGHFIHVIGVFEIEANFSFEYLPLFIQGHNITLIIALNLRREAHKSFAMRREIQLVNRNKHLLAYAEAAWQHSAVAALVEHVQTHLVPVEMAIVLH